MLRQNIIYIYTTNDDFLACMNIKTLLIFILYIFYNSIFITPGPAGKPGSFVVGEKGEIGHVGRTGLPGNSSSIFHFYLSIQHLNVLKGYLVLKVKPAQLRFLGFWALKEPKGTRV